MSLKFRVKNLLYEDLKLSCCFLKEILNLNGINSEHIEQSIENDHEWIVFIDKTDLHILEKKYYQFQGLYYQDEYYLHFSLLQENQQNLPSESHASLPRNPLSSSQYEDYQRSTGNPGRQEPVSYQVSIETQPHILVSDDVCVDDDHKTILVHDVPKDLDMKFLEVFLENRKLSGGGKICSLKRIESSTDVEVRFENLEVIDEVLRNSPLKFNNLIFPISKKPINNLIKTKPEESKEPNVVEVHGVPDNLDLEIVKLYFENGKKSGGGSISNDLIRHPLTGTVLITFDSVKDAESVVNHREHIFHGQVYKVNFHHKSEVKQFFLSDVKAGLMKDSIVNFLESKTEISVKDALDINSGIVWIVQCNDIVNLSQVQELCKENTLKFLSETYPKVSPIPPFETFLVKILHLAQNFEEMMIQLYFQSFAHEHEEVKLVQKLSADQFLVTFNDPVAVPEICFRKHKFLNTELQVFPYIKNLENNETVEEDYLLTSPFILDLMKKYKLTVDTMLQPKVTPIWTSSHDRVLKIKYSRSTSQEEALKIVENLLQNIYEETVSLSAEMAMIMTQEEPLNTVFSYNSSKQELRIAAFGEEAIIELKKNLHLPSDNSETSIISLDAYKILLISAHKFPQKIQAKYPEIKLENGKNKLILKGAASYFPQVKNEVFEFVNSIKSSTVYLAKYSTILLKKKQVKNYIIENFKAKKCLASWEIKENNSVMIFSIKADQLPIVSKILQSSFKSLNFGSKVKRQNVSKENDAWQKYLTWIQNNFAEFCYLDPETLNGVAVDFAEEVIQSKFKVIFESNTFLEKLIPINEEKAEYLKHKKMEEIKEFCHGFESQNLVVIRIQPDHKVFIKAKENDDMDKAEKFIKSLLKYFVEMKSTMEFWEDKKKSNEKKSTQSKPLHVTFQMKFNNQTLYIYKDDITQLPVDAIVNAANQRMNHGGGIAKAIVEKGGSIIQTESTHILSAQNFKPVEVGNAIITTAGDLPCKHVIHAVGPEWQNGKCNERNLLLKAVKTSLEFADKRSLSSIAFPAISAGSYKYPLDEAVHVIVSAVKEYLDEHSQTKLREIYFVDIRNEVTEKFQHQIIHIFSSVDENSKKKTLKPVSGSAQSDGSTPEIKKPVSGSAQSDGSTPGKSLVPKKPVSGSAQSDGSKPGKSLVIKKGQLEKSKCDIIVNSVSNDLDLSKGQLSRAVLQGAGPEIQNQCRKYSSLSFYQVIVTLGYNLACHKVFHITLPPNTVDIETIIQKYMKICLTEADNYKSSSIAFPSLGTGQLSYSPTIVAKNMIQVAHQYLSKVSTTLTKVNIIIYPKDDQIFKIFEDEVKNLPRYPDVNITFKGQDQKSPKGMGVMDFVRNRFWPKSIPDQASVAKVNQDVPVGLPKNPPDFTLGTVKIYLINGDLLNEVTDAIVHCTDANFSLKGAISRCLSQKSGSQFIKDCQNKVSEMSRNHFAVSSAHGLKCRLIIHLDIVSQISQPEKILETCFSSAEMYKISSLSFPQLATAGKNVSLDEMAVAMVQVISNLKGKHLKQVNVVLYQASMVSNMKSAINNAKAGVLVPQKMKASDILKTVTLQSNDAEYRNVQKEFLSTLRRTPTIVSIEKINNQPLKVQYKAQLAKITAFNPQEAKNERILWHGTKLDTVMKISKNGFDRGYCGANGTWHGKGVYFACFSEYSDQAMYSPPDTKGHKHMFMCHVATGAYVQGRPDLNVLPENPKTNQKYDSAVNNITLPTVFIIFNDVQAYPAYHITYY